VLFRSVQNSLTTALLQTEIRVKQARNQSTALKVFGDM
jgi:hypothetical protein